MIQRLPQYAEHHFAVLCASAGVVCNASLEDECGWDFFLQFPPERTPTRPADMQPPGPEALVQVKSTRSRPLTARLKLSNAFRAAQAAQPCFVVLVVPSDQGTRTYATHFWQDEIARTLRRVRLVEQAGETTFHKKFLELRLDEADRHDQDLLEWMRATISAVKPSYAVEKARIAMTVGHEDGFGVMKMTMEGTADDLLDLHLGLIDELQIRKMRYVPERFGIKAAKAELEAEEAQLSVTPVGKPGKLRLQGGSPTEELVLDAVLYTAAIPWGKETLHRWRVDAGPLRIIGGSGVYKANLSMRYDQARPLSAIATFLTLSAWRGAGPVGLHLSAEDLKASLGMLILEGEDKADAEWKEVRGWVRALQDVTGAAQTTEPALSIIDLDDAQPWIPRFAGFVVSPSIRIEYEPEGKDDPTRAAIYYTGCDVGEWCFLAVVERNTVTDEMVGAVRRLIFGPPQLLDAVVRKGSWRDHEAEIEAAYNAQIARLGKPETLWELGEIEAHIARSSKPREPASAV
jgi:hypothetical protein